MDVDRRLRAAPADPDRLGVQDWPGPLGTAARPGHGHPDPGRADARPNQTAQGQRRRTTRPLRQTAVPAMTPRAFDPNGVGWRIGQAREPPGGQLWVPWDRTTGVIGPQGSGKTLDLLTPALLAAPGAAL